MQYFDENELLKLKKHRSNLLWVFGVTVALYLLFTAGFLTWFILLPYDSPTQTVIKAVEYVVTGLVIIFLFVFMGIPFKRTNRNYKFCIQLKNGQRVVSEGSFFECDEDIQYQDGIDCKALIFIEWNKYKKDYFERKVLVFYDRPFPEIPQSQDVRYVTQGNFLISYEFIDQEEKTQKIEEQTPNRIEWDDSEDEIEQTIPENQQSNEKE